MMEAGRNAARPVQQNSSYVSWKESNNNQTTPREARVTQGPVNQGLNITKHYKPLQKCGTRPPPQPQPNQAMNISSHLLDNINTLFDCFSSMYCYICVFAWLQVQIKTTECVLTSIHAHMQEKSISVQIYTLQQNIQRNTTPYLSCMGIMRSRSDISTQCTM
jgi:hypothetical protein